MAYIPDALDATQPDINVDASTAAAEFRALKAQLKLVGTTVTTWNQNDKDASIELLGGNLISVKLSGALGAAVRATFPKSTGKYYWEIAITLLTASMVVGIGQIASSVNAAVGSDALSYGYRSDGSSVNSGVAVAMGAAYVTGDTIGIAHDFDLGIVSFYKIAAGIATLQGTIATGWLTNINVYPMHSMTAIGDITVANFGGGAFAVAALPVGYAAYGTAPASITSAVAVNSAVSVTLTASSAGYQYVTMTTPGQHVQLPPGTTMLVGGPRFLIQNDGLYPFGIRDGAGTLLTSVMPTGDVLITNKLNTTVAGAWGLVGNNLEAGLVTLDNIFSSTFLNTTIFKPFVALTNDLSIHFLRIASGFAAVAVDNVTRAVGTPVTVSAAAGRVPVAAFKITTLTAIVFFNDGVAGTNTQAVVLSITAPTTIVVGTASASTGDTAWDAEDSQGAPKIVQLSPTLYMTAYSSSTGATATNVRSIEVTAGTTVTIGAAVNIIATNSVLNSTVVYMLDATHALVIYLGGAAAPFTISAVVITVASVVCTVNAPVAISASCTGVAAPMACLLSPTDAIVADDNNTTTQVRVTAITIAGIVITTGATVAVETGMTTVETGYTTIGYTRANPHLAALTATTALLNYRDTGSANRSRSVVVTKTLNVMTVGIITFSAYSTATAANPLAGIFVIAGTTEFFAVQNFGVGSSYRPALIPHKINGTVITPGVVVQALDFGPNSSDQAGQVVATRLTSGDYILLGASTIPYSAMILRSNGDVTIKRPSVSIPMITGVVRPLQLISPSRILLIGAIPSSAVVGTQTLVRCFVMEVATP